MKIIMNNIKTETEAQQSFYAVERAIKDNIEEGRHNFKSYTFSRTNNTITVCKNKNSFTTYVQED